MWKKDQLCVSLHILKGNWHEYQHCKRSSKRALVKENYRTPLWMLFWIIGNVLEAPQSIFVKPFPELCQKFVHFVTNKVIATRTLLLLSPLIPLLLPQGERRAKTKDGIALNSRLLTECYPSLILLRNLYPYKLQPFQWCCFSAFSTCTCAHPSKKRRPCPVNFWSISNLCFILKNVVRVVHAQLKTQLEEHNKANALQRVKPYNETMWEGTHYSNSGFSPQAACAFNVHLT